MEPPNFSNSSPTKPNNNSTKKTTPKLPTPQELITHYESKGMNSQEASIKVIDDLQNALFRVVSSTNKGKKNGGDTSRKLDLLNARLAIVEKKLDSKPGFVGSFGIGCATATAFRGVAAVWPQVVGVWNSVRGLSKT
ncbi:hypothetical protein RND81_04G116600 [Saponaria officinalis]|uniref:Uncharacterized protein n=1 Tax=Saponaria officinalis TaxID=3572 RepID=A0AAW1LL10_SAPOF